MSQKAAITRLIYGAKQYIFEKHKNIERQLWEIFKVTIWNKYNKMESSRR